MLALLFALIGNSWAMGPTEYVSPWDRPLRELVAEWSAEYPVAERRALAHALRTTAAMVEVVPADQLREIGRAANRRALGASEPLWRRFFRKLGEHWDRQHYDQAGTIRAYYEIADGLDPGGVAAGPTRQPVRIELPISGAICTTGR